ncbi:hypothetical protein FACS1894199_02740 [Bacteroidia bacterium]|nr:hypothetical protein FACS1894199_02740 [Bacteroidia bacterium]
MIENMIENMIAKQLSAKRSFGGVIRYNEKNASELLEIENFPTDDIELFRDCLETYTALGNVREDKVFHNVLSFPLGEVLTNDEYKAITKDYMKGLGYGQQPYATFLHTDKEHLHLHIVSSCVDFNDPQYRKIDDYMSKIRSFCVGAIIEQKYDLESVLKKKLPVFLQNKVNGFFEQDKDMEEYFKHWRKDLKPQWVHDYTTENKPVNSKLVQQVNDMVEAAMREKPRSIAQLKKILEPNKVEIIEAINKKTGKQQGLLFTYHRQNPTNATAELVEKGIPSSKLPCFSEIPLMQQLMSNRKEYKAAKTYISKQLAWILKKAKDREELQKTLETKDIGVTWHENKGGIYGVSFTYKNMTLKGSEIGKNYTMDKITAFILLNSQQSALQQQQRDATARQSQNTSGSLGGATGKSKDDSDEDEDDEDEVTGKHIKIKRK